MKKPRTLLYCSAAAALGLCAGLLSTITHAQVRFDHIVRNDFFAGFTGNKEALERGMQVTAQVLAENPKHAEALVWHGAGVFFGSAQAFMSGDREKGMEMFQNGLAEMDRAVDLAPDNIGVRIPRGAALLAAARNMPGNPSKPGLFQRALADHQRAFDLQKSDLDQMGTHPKGELLFALADVNSRIGKPVDAEMYFQMILDKLPNTPYAKRAAAWMETKQPLPANQTNCIGCHMVK